MALTDADIKATKVPYGRNQFKVSDGGGLYLLVKSSGRYWKLAYRFDGKQKTLAFGVYPAVSIDEARIKRDEAKALLAENIDPGEIRKQERMEQRAAASDANEYKNESSGQSRISTRPAALSSHEQSILEERRFCILTIIANSKSYAISEDQLLEKLDALGHKISFDRLRTDVAWLSEQHAVQLKTGALWGVYLTQMGMDALAGRLWIPGIKRLEENQQEDDV